MSWRYYRNYHKKATIETDAGIKAKSKRGAFVETWWADRWIRAMERLMDRGRLSRGRRYARKGQVLSLEEKPGKVTAKVQGSRVRPYDVKIHIEPLSARQWQKVMDALAERPIFMAQLLAGEMPQDIEEAFTAAGLSLFPTSAGELTQSCNCPDWAPVCKHLAAVHYILAERFDEDPFLLFRLRGKSQEELLKALGKRGGAGLLKEEAAPEYETPPALPASTAEFWGGGPPLHFPVEIEPPPVPYPALARLGTPTFMEEIQQWLGPAYDAMSKAAVASVFVDASATSADNGEEA